MALFTGAILTATSVGITARVLKDLNRMNSEEGTAILAAAVIDDILGIIVLAMVVGIIGAAVGGKELNFIDSAWNSVVPKSTTTDILWIILKAAVFWGLVLYIGIKYSETISNIVLLRKFFPVGMKTLNGLGTLSINPKIP